MKSEKGGLLLKKRQSSFTARILVLLIVVAALLIGFIPAANAEKGVGLAWSTKEISVKEGEKTCVTYGVYNPFDEDSVVKLYIIGEAKNFLASQSSEKVFVRSGTSHDRSQLVEVCFEVQPVYEEACLIGGMMCEQACRGEPVKFESEVLAAGTSTKEESLVVGSATEFGVSSALDITVECVPKSRDLRVAYYASGIIAMSLASYAFYRRVLKKKKKR